MHMKSTFKTTEGYKIDPQFRLQPAEVTETGNRYKDDKAELSDALKLISPFCFLGGSCQNIT